MGKIIQAPNQIKQHIKQVFEASQNPAHHFKILS